MKDRMVIKGYKYKYKYKYTESAVKKMRNGRDGENIKYDT